MMVLTGSKLLSVDLNEYVKGSCRAKLSPFIIIIIVGIEYKMIQINEERSKQVERTAQEHRQQRQADSLNIYRIIYASVLIVFLLLISFYFDLLSDYDALSLVLGFVVCIILEFFFLSYYFRHQINKYKIDEIGLLKWKIKLIFGELNPNHIQRKNKIKYYHHEPNEKDRLFHKDNQIIYQNVMSRLRGKEEPNFTQIISKTKIKWNFLQEKMMLLQKFLAQMVRQYENRRYIYSRYKYVVEKTKEKRQFKQWQQFLKQGDGNDKKASQLLNNTSFYSQHTSHPNNNAQGNTASAQFAVNWQVFNWFILQKMKLSEKDASCLKDNIVKEYNIYTRNIKECKESNNKLRDKLLLDFKAARDDKNYIVRQIERIYLKYSIIKESLDLNKIKQEEDVEAILKKEFDLRLQKIELENYELKISRAQSFIYYTSQLLHNHLEQEEMELQDHLNKLNSKFTNYINMMAGIGETRTPIIEKYLVQPQSLPSQDEAPITYESLVKRLNERSVSQSSFKKYLAETLNLFKQIQNNHSYTQSLIQQFKPKFQRSSSQGSKSESRLKKEMTGARLHYYASNVKDLKILKMFEKLNSFQAKLAEKMGQYLQRQSRVVNEFETSFGSSKGRDFKKSQEQIRKKQDELKRVRRRMTKEQLQTQHEDTEIISLKNILAKQINHYLELDKIATNLIQIIQAMIQNESQYQKYADQLAQQEQFERSNQRDDNEQTQARQKYIAYANCIEKQDTQQFEDDTLQKQEYRQFQKEKEYLLTKAKVETEVWSYANYCLQHQKNKQVLKMAHLNTYRASSAKSLQIINKVLGVLVNQWSKSQFFHQFVKEQLLTSLNRKKPDIVENLNIEYFKIVQRNKSIGPIKYVRVHQSQNYRCLLDFVLDFKGKIAVQIGTKLKISKKPALQIKLIIQQFQCPIRLCLTPYSIGKSYASLLERPKISIDYSVSVGDFNLTKIPFFNQLIKTYIVLKLRKKMLWPKRMTLAVPLAFKSTLDLAILQRTKYEREKQKIEKKLQ